MSAGRALAFWLGAILPGVPIVLLAMACVALGWAVGRLLPAGSGVTVRCLPIAAGLIVAAFILLPRMG